MNSKTSDRKRAEGTISVPVSAFPLEMWEEWNSDCQKRFGDCRLIKMWNDHNVAKNMEMYSIVVSKVELLEGKIEVLVNELNKLQGKDVSKEKIKTFTKVL